MQIESVGSFQLQGQRDPQYDCTRSSGWFAAVSISSESRRYAWPCAANSSQYHQWLEQIEGGLRRVLNKFVLDKSSKGINRTGKWKRGREEEERGGRRARKARVQENIYEDSLYGIVEANGAR